MKPGDVSNVLRSATGFHIVKLQETRSRNAPTVVEQTRARHILIKVNEIVSESEAKAKIERIRDRLDTGAKFEDQAKLNSEDATLGEGRRARLDFARATRCPNSRPRWTSSRSARSRRRCAPSSAGT